MEFHTLANSKIKISKTSLGTWSLGGEMSSETQYKKISKKNSIKIILFAHEMGINFFDTSPTYGNSHKILGECFQKNRKDIVISTKIGINSYKEEKKFNKKFISEQIYNFLKDIKTDYIDIIYFYCPDPKKDSINEAYQYLNKLKENGIIRSIGVSVANPSDLNKFNKNIKFEIAQCNFNILDNRIIQKENLNYIQKNLISIVARTIFCFGIFTEKFLKNGKKIFNNDHRNRWSNEQLKKWKEGIIKIKEINTNQSIEQIALRFVNSFNFISSSLIGVQNIFELKSNLREINSKKLKKNILKKIIEINNKNNFFLKNNCPNKII